MRKLVLWLTVVAVLGGCGSRESFRFHSQGGSSPASGTIVVRPTLPARAIPAEVSRLVFSGIDAEGAIVYGPLNVAKSGEMRLEGVPVKVVHLDYVLLAGGEIFGFGGVDVEVVAGQTTVVQDPPFQTLGRPVERLDLSPLDTVASQGQTVRYTARANFATGEVLDLTSLVEWSSADIAVAAISNDEGERGLVRTSRRGTTEITALLATSQGTLTASTSLQVLEAVPVELTVATEDGGPAVAGVGLPLELRALIRYSNGVLVEETAQWTSLSPDIATVGETSGAVVGVSSGNAIIRASFSGLSGELPVTVNKVALTDLELNFPELLLASRGTRQLKAFGLYQDGTRRELTNAVEWESDDTAVAAITPDGLVLSQGVAGDSTILTARLGEHEAACLATLRQDLYLTDTTSGIVHQRVDDDESLPSNSQTKFQSGTDYQELEFHPSGTHLFALTDDGRLQAFSISATTGALSLRSEASSAIISTAFLDRVSVQAHPSGKLLYLGAQGFSQIEAFSFDSATGELTALGTVATAPSPLFGLAIEPEGRFLYALRPGAAQVLGYAIEEQGALTALGATALPASIVNATTIATAERQSPLLYLAGDTDFDGFRIEADGSLSAAPILPASFADQAEPNRLAIRGTGTGYQLVSLSAANPVWRVVSILTGTVSPGSGAATFGATSFGLAFSSSGRTVYRQTNTGLLQWIPPGFELAPFGVSGPTARSLVATP